MCFERERSYFWELKASKFLAEKFGKCTLVAQKRGIRWVMMQEILKMLRDNR